MAMATREVKLDVSQLMELSRLRACVSRLVLAATSSWDPAPGALVAQVVAAEESIRNLRGGEDTGN